MEWSILQELKLLQTFVVLPRMFNWEGTKTSITGGGAGRCLRHLQACKYFTCAYFPPPSVCLGIHSALVTSADSMKTLFLPQAVGTILGKTVYDASFLSFLSPQWDSHGGFSPSCLFPNRQLRQGKHVNRLTSRLRLLIAPKEQHNLEASCKNNTYAPNVPIYQGQSLFFRTSP